MINVGVSENREPPANGHFKGGHSYLNYFKLNTFLGDANLQVGVQLCTPCCWITASTAKRLRESTFPSQVTSHNNKASATTVVSVHGGLNGQPADSQEFHKLWFPNQDQPNSTLDGQWPVKSCGARGLPPDFSHVFSGSMLQKPTKRMWSSCKPPTTSSHNSARLNRGDLRIFCDLFCPLNSYQWQHTTEAIVFILAIFNLSFSFS